MSKKYYVVIASLLKALLMDHAHNSNYVMAITDVMHGLIEIMKKDNPNFQESKFLEAVLKF